MKLGVLGGTFDPIHIGHLLIAQEALERVPLDRVIFVPARDPWLKGNRPITLAETRFEMVRLAIEENPAFQVSRVDLERSGPTYSVDTLRDVKAACPTDTQLYFIMGLDSLWDFPRWKDPAGILSLSRLLVFSRPGAKGAGLARVCREVPGLKERSTIFKEVVIDINSTELRERVKRGLTLRYWVPEPVARYIQAKGLYQED